MQNVANQIIAAGSAKEVRMAISSLTPEQQYEALKMSAEQILVSVEVNIAQKNHQIAIWELSKLAIVEDELLKAERRMNNIVSAGVHF